MFGSGFPDPRVSVHLCVPLTWNNSCAPDLLYLDVEVRLFAGRPRQQVLHQELGRLRLAGAALAGDDAALRARLAEQPAEHALRRPVDVRRQLRQSRLLPVPE